MLAKNKKKQTTDAEQHKLRLNKIENHQQERIHCKKIFTQIYFIPSGKYHVIQKCDNKRNHQRANK